MACALAAGRNIVLPEFFTKLVDAITNRKPHPVPADFLPPRKVIDFIQLYTNSYATYNIWWLNRETSSNIVIYCKRRQGTWKKSWMCISGADTQLCWSVLQAWYTSCFHLCWSHFSFHHTCAEKQDIQVHPLSRQVYVREILSLILAVYHWFYCNMKLVGS